MNPKKLIIIFAMLLCLCLAISGCQSEKNTVKQIEADRVVITHEVEYGVSDAEATITDEETVAEIVQMHNTIQIKNMDRPMAPDRFILTFYSGEDMVATWLIAIWDDGTIITASGETFGGGNHVVTNDFDYDRLAEILSLSVE